MEDSSLDDFDEKSEKRIILVLACLEEIRYEAIARIILTSDPCRCGDYQLMILEGSWTGTNSSLTTS